MGIAAIVGFAVCMITMLGFFVYTANNTFTPNQGILDIGVRMVGTENQNTIDRSQSLVNQNNQVIGG